ncbi:MAG: IclR family transcriptional regulator [Rhodospirillales bacterium]|nr:IclR family transcriptional regulator [Rhodospirillales bacterium]MBO6788223.1 IclR family transcriptional regulator [Rhodospirillales bacterium]
MPDGDTLPHITPPDTGSALGKGMTVLSVILTAEKPPSLNDIAERTNLPRPTVFRVVKQLEETLMITRAPDGDKYLVGPNLMSLATDAMSAFVHASPVRAILSGLVHELGETCNLGVLDRDSVVYIDRVECSWPLRLQMGVGTHVSLHATALGKLLVAHLPTRSRRRVINAAPLQRFTDFSITDPKLLEAEFKMIRRQGYACNNEENTIGIIGIAVPVFDARNRVVAGLSVHAPAARMSMQTAVSKLDRLRDTARQIEQIMRELTETPNANKDAAE